jgi:putative ABC transport system substrate-binding protein
VDRRAFIAAVTGSLLAPPLADEAQAVEKVWRIGYFSAGSSQYDKSRRISFVEGLRGLGYVQGQNIVIETRYPNGDQARLAELAADLVQSKIDIIVTSGNTATIAARQATATIPIVMLLGVDPIGLGLIASFRRPGGNVTGLSWDPSAPEMMAKNVEFLKEAVSSLARVGILYTDFPGLEPYRKATEDTARKLGLNVMSVEFRTPSSLDDAFRLMLRKGTQGVCVFGSALAFSHQGQIVEQAAKHRLPAIYVWRETAALGGLMSYGPDVLSMFRGAATYVDKILKGAAPADLPVEQPTKFELVINLKTAKALGLTIPPSLLQRADQVIE